MRKLLASLVIALAALSADAQSIYGGSWFYPLGQANIPLVLPSSGSMGNNGALTITTSLPATYANAYIYMPAGAIAAASTAGWYYGQCSSATACTLFNNTYTSGTPIIPASPTAFATTGPGAYTQVTTEVAAYEVAIPANLLGPNGSIEGHSLYTYPNNSNAKTLRARVGTQGTSGNSIMATGPTTSASLGQLFGFVNRGLTNSQVPNFMLGNAGVGGGSSALTYFSVDTTQIQWINTTLQLAAATDFIVLENVNVRAVLAVP